MSASPRRPLPPGTEILLTCEPRGWRGELRDGPLRIEARGDTPEAVLAELLRQYDDDEREHVPRVPGIGGGRGNRARLFARLFFMTHKFFSACVPRRPGNRAGRGGRCRQGARVAHKRSTDCGQPMQT